MRWILPAEQHDLATRLSRELSLHPICSRILVARGCQSPDAAAELLRDRLADLPDPAGMKGMDLALERVLRALHAGERITLYGDYDVDGVTATAITAHFLRALGAHVATYIPKRLEEGYGLNREAIERIAADGSRLLVALDCGVSAVAEVGRARELGLDVVVVDHHQPGPTLPPAVALLDPHQPGCTFPGKQLCAAGVAFFLLVALRRELRARGFFAGRAEPNLRDYLDLVALGTVADVVPLVGVNRILVKHGLAELARARRTGIRALKTVAGFGAGAPLTAGQVAFRLAPRVNAAGRLADASAGLELLLTEDETRAVHLARALDEANRERQEIEKRMLDEAMAQAQPMSEGTRSLVLASENFHPGVVGIVASRVVERFHRPTFVVALDQGSGRGSGRSIEGFHLYAALQRCAEHLERFGGHHHAAGLTVNEARLPSFREAFEALARAELTDQDLVARCRIDAVVAPDELDEELAEAVQQLAPFGAGNPEPVLAALKLQARPRLLAAKDGGTGHLKLSIEGSSHLDVIGFGMAERAAIADAPLDAAFHFGIDEWNGRRKLSVRLKDLRPAG